MIQDIYLIIIAIVGLAAYVVKIQLTASINAKNHTELKTEMNVKTDKLEIELNNKVDKLEKAVFERMETIQDHIKTIEDKMTSTQMEVVEIKSDTKHIRESIHHMINLFNQHVLSKDA
jgi:phage host-nuclease inhibitor protein Gam